MRHHKCFYERIHVSDIGDQKKTNSTNTILLFIFFLSSDFSLTFGIVRQYDQLKISLKSCHVNVEFSWYNFE